jgi:nitroimidazol reductase NimA-like FMN-containing flavoprotein (pyridoxamine 5'-phosphate oxidase superfamily)
MEHVHYAQTRGLNESEVQERLETTETGVLALANGDEAYALPLAHYFDGDRLFLRFGLLPESKKATFLDATETATYLLYGTEPTDAAQDIDSWSILLTGSLSEIPTDEYENFDTAAINRQFAPIRVFGEAIEAIDIAIYEFEIDTMTGRATLAVE